MTEKEKRFPSNTELAKEKEKATSTDVQKTQSVASDQPGNLVPVLNTLGKLKEVSSAVTKLGKDLEELVLVLEEIVPLLSAVTGQGTGKGSNSLPLNLLTSLIANRGGKSDSNLEEDGRLDTEQLLLSLLSQGMGKNR